MVIDRLVEGLLDELVSQRLIRHTNHQVGTVYGKKGIAYIRQKVNGFNVKAQHGNPLSLLVDFMDTRLNCPPEVLHMWLPDRSSRLLFRVVVNEIESWLLADTDGIAETLGVRTALIPKQVETLVNPKRTVVNLARNARFRHIREALVPKQGSSASVGAGYNDVMGEFVLKRWNITAARRNANSLERCLIRLADLNEQYFTTRTP